MAIHNAPGRGRKFCNSCQKYIGVRSKVCPNCAAVFGSSLRLPSVLNPLRTSGVVPRKTELLVEVSDTTSEEDVEIEDTKVRKTPSEKGSRIDRINHLKTELIRELKISSKMYAKEIISDIVREVGTDRN